MTAESKSGFNIHQALEQQLRVEILQSERIRIRLLSILALLVAAAIGVNVIIFKSSNVGLDHDFTASYFAAGALIIFSLREIIIVRIFEKRISAGKDIVNKLRYLNLFFETSIPSLILIILSYYWESVLVLSTPVIFLYLIIVILTTLSLDFKLSLFAGTIAAVEFLVITFFLLSKHNYPAELFMLNEPYIHMGKGLLIFVSGVIAGYVANRIKNKIRKTYQVLWERNRIVNLFGQQVSQEIVDELLSHETELESKRKFVCIMFLDIRGFTQFAESKEPEEIIDYQNKVFGFMIEAITNNHGIINQFLGDGYMATFGAPVSKGNDCRNAFNAALEILEKINRQIADKVIPPMRIGIGLHAGFIVAGNVGTAIRKQYSISGNTVIIASRIEQLNKEFDSQLLISEEVLREIDKNKINYQSLGNVELKGREKPIHIYKIA